MSKSCKWYWVIDNTKQILKNLFLKEQKDRYWMITETRLTQLRQIEKDYKLKEAECNLYRTMFQVQTEKFNEATRWVNENWKGFNNEK